MTGGMTADPADDRRNVGDCCRVKCFRGKAVFGADGQVAFSGQCCGQGPLHRFVARPPSSAMDEDDYWEGFFQVASGGEKVEVKFPVFDAAIDQVAVYSKSGGICFRHGDVGVLFYLFPEFQGDVEGGVGIDCGVHFLQVLAINGPWQHEQHQEQIFRRNGHDAPIMGGVAGIKTWEKK